mgnify:CR=1 FL=1
MKKTVIVSLAIVLFTGLAGCMGGTPVKEAPLSQSKLNDLRSTLPGTWKLTYRKSDRQAKRKPVDVVIKKWSFRQDGTGTITAGSDNPVTGKTTRSNDFTWSLEGRNLVIGKDGKHFRVDNWQDDEMLWFHYQGSNYYVIERID